MIEPVRIANCSGFFGDRPSGALEMVEGGPIDVLTGDWLAELTMLILARTRARQQQKGRAGGGYARTFIDQMEQVMGTCLDRGIKVVSNAGGLDPAGCAEALSEIADRLGLSPTVAFVDGDDLMPRIESLVADDALQPFDPEVGLPSAEAALTANAYLGCWGIVEALDQGADIVVTGRVTDAAVTCGPAAWHHAWARDDFDALAGAVVAGHVIECSAQATGGNYSFFTELPAGPARIGFPWAEVAGDGSSIIGKHEDTGGAVTVGTVTSQLLYEIGGAEYLGPDVTARFDTITVEQADTDRVRISGVRGQAPPSTLKVATNEVGGFRNSFTVALTGLDIDAKAAMAQRTFWDACPYSPDDFDSIDSRVIRADHVDPSTQEAATAVWRVTVKDADETKVGRAFSDAMVHTALASIPGMYGLGGAPGGASPYGVYRPATVPAALVPARVHIGGDVIEVSSVAPDNNATPPPAGTDTGDLDAAPRAAPPAPTSDAPLGTIAGTRSGDKGGNANLGVFVRSAQAWDWLDGFLTVDRLKVLLPETRDLRVERHGFPNLWALNFVIVGLLDEGVAASTRQDSQAKALGEWLRARDVPVPRSLLDRPTPSRE